MTNAGTFDGTIGFWVVLCLMLPIAFALLARVVWGLVACVEAVMPLTQKILIQPQKIVYRDREKVVYQERPKPTKRKSPKPTKTTASETTITTDSQIITDATDALKVLGFNATDIKRAIKNLCTAKDYSDTESLLSDCLRELK